MANWFSDHYGTDGSADSTIASPTKIVSAGIGHARQRYKRASVTVTDTAAADVLRMMTFKSGDRLSAMFISTDGGFSASSSTDVGLFTSSNSHDGAALDADLFDAAVDVTSAIDREEILTDGALSGVDRGKTLWEQYAVGAGSDSTDPLVNYDIGITLNADDDATSSTIVLEVWYTSGD